MVKGEVSTGGGEAVARKEAGGRNDVGRFNTWSVPLGKERQIRGGKGKEPKIKEGEVGGAIAREEEEGELCSAINTRSLSFT